MEWYTESKKQNKTKKQNLSTNNSISSKAVLQKWQRDKDFPKQKVKDFITTTLALKDMLEGDFLHGIKGY